MRRAATFLLVGTAVILAAALLSAGGASANPGSVIVEITDGGYNPSVVTISPDSTVTWTNVGSEAHSVTGEAGGVLDSPAIAPRFAYSYTFHATGTYTYHDGNSQGFKGTVIVVDGAVPPQPTPSTPPPAPSSSPSAIPPTPTPSGVGDDDAAAGDELSSGGAQGASPADSPSTRSIQGNERVAPAPQALPSLANITAIDIGNEWFGEPSFQGGVYESVIQTGASVDWNVLDGLHNVYECGDNWSGADTSCAAAGWNSDQVITTGGTFSRTFDSPGAFYYLCTIHPATMRGRVVVEGTQNTPPDASAPPDDLDPQPTVAQALSVPNGGGPLGDTGDGRLIMILIGAAAAFVISTAGFIVGGGVSTED